MTKKEVKILQEISRLEDRHVMLNHDNNSYFLVEKGSKQRVADMKKAAKLRKSIGWV